MIIKQIDVTRDFLKSVSKLSNKEKGLLVNRQEIFCLNPYDTRLKTHKLKGKLAGRCLFSVNYTLRVVFELVQTNKVLFLDIGTHEVYK
jgi:mRNA-degrading endonuclease YafQ of YafQ-DinJ toxin-antitoxin module